MSHTDGDDFGVDYVTDDSQQYSPQDSKENLETIGLDFGDDSSNQGETYDEPNFGQPLRDQDRYLPIANISKIMKQHVPEAGKIAKDAKECVQECVSEFISFITSEAGDVCAAEKRKTINGEDILKAMSALGFDNYLEPLKLYLQKIREASKGDKPAEVEELPDDVPPNVVDFSNIFEQNSQSDPIIFFQDPIQHFQFL